MWTLILCKSDWPRIINFYVECWIVWERTRDEEKNKKEKKSGVFNMFYFCLTFSAYHNTTTSVLSRTETEEKQFLKSSADLGVVSLSWEKIWRSWSWHICVFVCAYINIHASFLCVRARMRTCTCACIYVWVWSCVDIIMISNWLLGVIMCGHNYDFKQTKSAVIFENTWLLLNLQSQCVGHLLNSLCLI